MRRIRDSSLNRHGHHEDRFRTLSSIDRDRVQAAIDVHAVELSRITGFVAARPGFPIRGGQLQREPAVIVYVRHKLRPVELPAGTAPRSLGQFPVDVRMADPETQIELLHPQADEAALAAHYDGIPGDPIVTPLEFTTPILCHVGPDAGWIPLRDFIAATQSTFQAAIYDFNAPYIADAITQAIGNAGMSMTLNIDSSMKDAELEIQNSLAQALDDRYASQVITCGGAGAFPSAYHEKVIVRDSEWVWISSGNWTRTSQPEKDPIGNPDHVTGLYKSNREYHLILQDEALASLLVRYLEHDRDQAAATVALGAIAALEVLPDLFVSLDELREDIGLAALAAPEPIAPQWLPSKPKAITISPVLSPDNYARRIDELIRSATRSLHLQYSYITWPKREKDFFFRDLLAYIGELSQRDDFDLKVIVGSGSATEKIAVLAENGWNEEKVHTQSPIHNKAIIVDGERVLVSSQNWSGDGFLWNRDAGIIIDDEEIAQYFEKVFDFDWRIRSRGPFEASLGAIVAGLTDPTPPGMVRMRWRDYYGD